jgi:hypothetical protein
MPVSRESMHSVVVFGQWTRQMEKNKIRSLPHTIHENKFINVRSELSNF